jgi:hypothetical protein
MAGTIAVLVLCFDMDQMATDLRAAAASARAFADTVESAELRESFRDMARRWEAEATQCEKRTGTAKPSFQGRANAPTSVNMKDR